MACSLTIAGRSLPCKDAIGGVKKVYFGEFDATDWGDVSNGAIGNSESAVTVYGFEVLKNTSYFTETITASVENGTVFYSQEVSLTFPKLTAADQAQLQQFGKGRLIIIVLDNNDNYWLVGVRRAAELTGGTASTGTAYGDVNGYQLTFTAEEPIPAPSLTKDTAAQVTFTEAA